MLGAAIEHAVESGRRRTMGRFLSGKQSKRLLRPWFRLAAGEFPRRVVMRSIMSRSLNRSP